MTPNLKNNKSGDSSGISDQLSTGLDKKTKLSIFVGHLRSSPAHSIQKHPSH